ncbi:restriction endonuclease subunit S [Lactiplantibacillus argentoratensis]|uniref:restriction endonuclease subunit S n=1 Tax=Lactiplantibacillus argentoratensis TaxID=271881 RepID=UPI001D082C71|nr:restriction endonuclease subunit S [Lactiplantibacillus argentoratensis]MCB7464458.1 restriction endonuclease subunit S [Lactiplantibacillus argentoratensis]
MKDNQAKYPQLRFKGFTDPWEERKLSCISERVTRKNKNNESTLPLTISAQDGLVDQNDFFNKQVASRDVTGYFLVKNGEFAYNKSYSNGYPWGAIKRLDKYDMGVLSTLYIVFRPTKINSQFLVSYYDTTRWYREVSKNAAEGARNHGLLNIAPTDFFNTLLVVPKIVDEQQKIGSFFKQLDDTIALHQRKLAKLKELKQGYLQKMFPKNDSKFPQLRFAGFADAWEQRKLKDVVEKQIKGKAQFEKLAPGDVEYLDTSRLNGGQAILTNGFKDVTLDDVLILWDGSKAGTVYHGFEGSLGSTLKAYRTSADSKFVYQYLKRHQDNIYNNYRTPNIPHVQKDFLDVFTISVPRSDEQAKIGSFFNQIDNTIALHQRKLEKLQELKKGYLQKMFC